MKTGKTSSRSKSAKGIVPARGIAPARRPTFGTAVATVAIAAVAGFGAVYVMARTPENTPATSGEMRGGQVAVPLPATAPVVAQSGPASEPPALPVGPGTNPLSRGEMAAFVFKKTPEPLPEFGFVDATAKDRTLKDWRGKVVLLNLWATWCLPCRKEMPGLERLQAELGSDKFEVIALSVDRTGLEGAKKFLASIKVEKLGLYADPAARTTSTLKALGMPATLLIDREGREIGRLVGPAEWDSADAKALIGAAVAAK